MMIALKHLRDFMSPEALRFLPGNLRVEACIIVKQTDTVENQFHVSLLVFDSVGTFMGEIKDPEYIPSKSL